MVALTVLVLVSMTDAAVRAGIGHVSVHPVWAEGNMNRNKFHPYGGHHRVGRRIDHRDALRTGIGDVGPGAVGTDGNIHRNSSHPYGGYYRVRWSRLKIQYVSHRKMLSLDSVSLDATPICAAVRPNNLMLAWARIAQKIGLARSRSRCDTRESSRTGLFVVTPWP